MVRRRARTKGLGVVVVLHDINLAARFCDEILALHSGPLLTRGTPDTIMTPARLQAIYGIPMDVIRHPRNGQLVNFPAVT